MELSGDILEEEFSCESLSCAAHWFQLCIEEGLSVTTIARAIGAAKKLVKHFRHRLLPAILFKNDRKRWEVHSENYSRTVPLAGIAPTI